MKRILAFLLVGLMIFMMSACSYKLVEVEDLNKDQGEKVLDDWQGDYEEFVVDVQSDAEDAAKAEEEEKKEAEKKEKEEAAKKKQEAEKKKQEAEKKKQEAAQNKTETPIVKDPIVEQVIEQPFVSETFPQPEPIPEPVPQPEPEQYPYDNPPFHGTNNADVYNNDYIGLNIRWPEGWEVGIDDQDKTLKRLLDEEYPTTTIHELVAVGPDGSSFQIIYSNLRKAEEESLTAEEHLKGVGERYQAMDYYSCVVEELHFAYLGGNEWSVQPIVYKEGRTEIYVTYYARKIDCFMVTMVLASSGGNSLHLEFY